ncbi:GtrA family protein [Jeotgalibaca caeni]|uniref:GtrA family protein n=1 Tax=Jeotgalibaca caeni TaxID=3028623 RepID=UPI00237ED6EA|nr:GtrA family protein [Jeotgalibaca caeni]MDE1548991.1 GtrA family protein [Jeotgalibaca caeni]
MEEKKNYKEVLLYLLFGVMTTAVNIVVFFLLEQILGWQYLQANIVAIVVSILFAFFTNQRYVFRSQSSTLELKLREFFLFVSFRAISGILDMLLLWMMVDGIGMDSTIAKVITQVLVVFMNYFFSKFFVFQTKKK